MPTFVQDVRCAVRQIAGSPVVALAVVVSLGLGIGATTATAGVFTGLAAFAATDFTLTHDGPSERLQGLAVSANYFSVLGVEAAAGRLLLPGEGAASPVVVLGYDLWQRRFGGDPGVVGRAVTVNGRSATARSGSAWPWGPGRRASSS